MEGSIFSMPSRDEKINIKYFRLVESTAYSASFPERFLLNVLQGKTGFLLYKENLSTERFL